MSPALAQRDLVDRAGPSVRLLAACALSAAVAVAPVLPALAQAVNPLSGESLGVLAGQPMVLEADQLFYDFDGETVTAVGNVQIYYGAYALDATRVDYDQRSGRLVASGGVRLLEPSGNIITAEMLDITDDFRDGFVGSLNVVTTDRARFAAQTAERRDGNLTIFRRGVYTACAACADDPSKPPLWQIKAARIIHDQEERTIYYEDATFEFFGVPIAYTPVFFHPDPTVQRKTGFLTPRFRHSDATGFGVTTPFFWNLAPNYDVTFSPTVLTGQGLLMQTEWRHRIMNGAYSVRLAGIFQTDKEAFYEDGERLSGYREFRGSAHTAGEFAISPWWTFGWDAHLTTDRTFNRDYRIDGATAQDLTSTLYLTGLSDRNFFDMRGYYFNVQRENTEELIPDGPDRNRLPDIYEHDDQQEQALVHPVIDHNYIVDAPVIGGELRLDSNLTSLSRTESDIRHPREFDLYYTGVAGNFTRATHRASWERRFIAPGGQLLTPFTYLQGDVSSVEPYDSAAGLTTDEVAARAMPAVGLDYEWPFLAMIGSTVHTIAPKAQIIARPDEPHAGDLPNEDAQSLVFDDTNLFVWDKFSGYDRQEGGTRSNIGVVYQGLFPNGASIDALAGQSLHLAGVNSFAEPDHALTGVGSGLETDSSDYVGRVILNSGTGLALVTRGRLDDKDLDVNRGEVNALAAHEGNLLSVGYAYLRESPSAALFEDRQEVNAAAVLGVTGNWSVLGSIIYDIDHNSPVTQSLGIAYLDECLEFSAVYSETPDQYSDLVTGRQVFVRLNLRTLGDDQLTSPLDEGT